MLSRKLKFRVYVASESAYSTQPGACVNCCFGRGVNASVTPRDPEDHFIEPYLGYEDALRCEVYAGDVLEALRLAAVPERPDAQCEAILAELREKNMIAATPYVRHILIITGVTFEANPAPNGQFIRIGTIHDTRAGVDHDRAELSSRAAATLNRAAEKEAKNKRTDYR